ncbi:MAG TPA: TIGR04211 family SH3 domain-containing protein [Gammaproteobacteria bacterium]|nr:TIGR04211 family SH3 domain-containing protein [Gammaproteobacteria bacterium]
MIKRILTGLTLSASIIASMSDAIADTRYISDELEITFRSEPGGNKRIIKMLKSGAPVEVLSVDKKSGYAKVRTSGGKTGYVLVRFLSKEPSAREQVQTMQERIVELQAEPDQIQSRLTQLQEDYSSLQQQHQKTSSENETLTQDLAGIKQTAANAIQIASERSDLRKQLTDFKRQNADLQMQNLELSNNVQQRWFMIGAGVVLGSLLLGWLLPLMRIRRRSRSSWSDI